MKIIDLLNKIANGEEVPKKIKYDNNLYIYDERTEDYFCEEKDLYLMYKLIGEDDWEMSFALTIKVEIIEEDKKIEKLKIVENGSINSYALLNKNGTKCALTKHSKIIADKINEIIDVINGDD